MRILLDYRPALRQRTGVGAFIHETALALMTSAPADESLVLFSSSWKDRLEAGVVPGASVIDRRIPVQLLNYGWHRLEWPPIEQVAGGDFDIAHSWHPLLIPSTTAAQLVTIHDLDFLDHPERTQAEIRRDYAPLARAHAQRADRVVVNSKHTAGEVERRLGIPPSRISVCMPGAPRWAPREVEPASGGCILFVGTLEPRKNLGLLVDAYERLANRRPDTPSLVLAGRATPDAESLVARLTRGSLAHRVEVLGYVDEARKRALYERALVLVLPSHTEGFGIPAVEAMAAGVPVVAADRGALPEVLDGAGALVDPQDPEHLASTLAALLDDAGARRRLSEAGRHRVRAFSWDRTAASVRGAWRLALDAKRSARG